MIAFIYSLSDPRSGEIRYVGKTIDTQMRISAHCSHKSSFRSSNWIKSLKKIGLRPQIETLEECDEIDWQEVERFWISYLRFLGARLTNLDGGGSGGKRVSEETREKMRRAHLGKKLTPEHRENSRRAKQSLSLETRQRMSVAAFKRSENPEYIAKIIASNRRRVYSEETKEKIRRAWIANRESRCNSIKIAQMARRQREREEYSK